MPGLTNHTTMPDESTSILARLEGLLMRVVQAVESGVDRTRQILAHLSILNETYITAQDVAEDD